MRSGPVPRSLQLVLAACLLVLFAAQTALGSPANSAALDEEYHLATGYAYLRTGDPRLSVEHPPLVNLWNALPLVFLNPRLPLDGAAWQNGMTDDFSDAFLWQANPDRAVQIVLLGRLPIMALGLLLGAVLFRWARDLFGARAGLVALGLYALDPNLIAQSRLSTTDLGLTFFILLAMWRLWVWLEKPTGLNLVFVGLAAGGAFATKFNGFILAPMFLFVALVHPVAAAKQGHAWSERIRRLAELALAGLLALAVVWAVYGFEVRGGLPAATYWRGVIKIWSEYSLGLPTYLMGEVNRTGWWYYFPFTFLVKTPLPTLILFVIGTILTLARGVQPARRAFAVLIPPALSMAAVLFSPLAFGYRHILPILPFVLILAGQAANWEPRIPNLAPLTSLRLRLKFDVRHLALGVLSIWMIWNAATIFPHHLSYFNELAGGPLGGDRFLVDSNLDWGQDLPALKTQMDRLGLDRVYLSYYGTALPAVYGIRYQPLPAFLHFVTGPEMDAFNPYTPEPGWYAISVTSLRMGLLWREPDLYAYFRDKTPMARAGYSIRLYQVQDTPGTAIDRTVVVGKPTYELSPEALGVRPERRLLVKWVDNPDAFVFAMKGPARYLAADPLPFDRDLRKAFRAAGQTEGEALVVNARPLIEPRILQWRASSRMWLPDGQELGPDQPASFGGKLALWGYRLAAPQVRPGGELELTTYWRMTGEIVPSIAYFVHVVDASQRIVGQYDGWATAVRGLEIGDVIVQHIRVPIQPDLPDGSYELRMGVYSPDTMARWQVGATSLGGEADYVRLSPIEVGRQ